MPIRQLASFGLKAFVSIFFLVYLLTAVRWEEVWTHVRNADALYVFLYVFLGFVGVVISSMKWLVLSRVHGMRPRLSYLVSLYMVGYFFNNFLPTSIGGDVVRAHALGETYGKKTEAMASVFVERFTGYTVLIAFALLAVTFDRSLWVNWRLVLPIGFAVFAYLGIVWAIASSWWLELSAKWVPLKVVHKILKKIDAFQRAIHMYRHETSVLLAAGIYSILFYLVTVAIVYAGCLAFHASVSIASLLTAVPVLLILFMIPFSLGGIGLQEWAFYFVMESVGVPAAVGVSLGLLFRARSIFFGILGGAAYPFVTRVGSVLAQPVPSNSASSAALHRP
jgi:uncharacterized protein (TIRG00374 family)